MPRHFVSLLLLIGFLAFASSASAAVTVGSSLRERANLFTRCASSCTEMAVARPGPLPGATIPSDGVITRWRVRAATQGAVRLRILRPQADGAFAPVAASSPAALNATHAPGRDASYEFAVSIPVQAGDVLALDRDAKAGALFHSADASYTAATFTPVVPEEGPGPAAPGAAVPGRELLLNADLERDADGDGLGDETQDPCPQVPASTPDVPCPPRTPTAPTSPVTPTPGSDGATVTGEGGPSRPSGNEPTGHETAPAVRDTPRTPAKPRPGSHDASTPTRSAPAAHDTTKSSGHAKAPSRRADPPKTAKQEAATHRAGRKRRPDPPATRTDRPSGHDTSSPARADPPKAKHRRRRHHAAKAPARQAPPPAPPAPGFAPH